MNVMLNNTMTVTSNNLNEDLYKFSVDWLNIRLDNVELETFFNGMHCLFPELSGECFVKRESGGVCYYPYAYYLSDCGYSSFIVNYALDDEGCLVQADTANKGQVYGILLSISGDGCRFINDLRPDGFFDFVNFLAGFDFNCTRIDVCCDILDKDNQIIPMIQEFAVNCNLDVPPIYLKSGMKRGSANYCTINPMWDKEAKDYVMNVTIGGRASKRGTLQIYDKNLELSNGRLSVYKQKLIEAYNNPDYWWRLEYRCKSFANDIFVELITSNSIYSTFLRACNRFGTFVIPPVSGLNHISEGEVLIEWACFLKFLEGLKNRKLFI